MARTFPEAACQAVNASSPRRASIVIVTYNGLVFTKLCLGSLLANTDEPDYEVIVIDNASRDGTVEYLRALAERYLHVRVVFNERNRGFAPATNQGLTLACGEVLVLLNNDTLVPHGWLARLARHLEDRAVGLVGPMTNAAGNEAQIEAPYRTYAELMAFAEARMHAHASQLVEIPMLTMFCLAMRRDVFERLGPLDERFAVGLFEDDDYSWRTRQAGYRVACAEDIFVHHFGQASFGKLVPTGDYGNLFQANRRRFEEKWGVTWQPHARRLSPEYHELSERIRAIVHARLPEDATVLVVSRGDEALLWLGGRRRGWHFPQAADGTYAGHYPPDSAAAITHLEALRARGADSLVLPATALWWLEHYAAWREHLERHYRLLVHETDTCRIYSLCEPRAGETVESNQPVDIPSTRKRVAGVVPG